MKTLKQLILLFSLTFFMMSCGALHNKNNSKNTVKIAKDKTEYEVLIIDPGYELFLKTEAKPKGFYSKNYLESKNRRYVQIWNSRVRNPRKYNPSIYENIIDYDPSIDYGMDLNYNLYNYFKFAEKKYHMKLE